MSNIKSDKEIDMELRKLSDKMASLDRQKLELVQRVNYIYATGLINSKSGMGEYSKLCDKMASLDKQRLAVVERVNFIHATRRPPIQAKSKDKNKTTYPRTDIVEPTKEELKRFREFSKGHRFPPIF